MTTDFGYFEQGIDRVYANLPGEARQQVLLTRLYAHVFKMLEARLNRELAEHGLNTSTWLALLLAYSSPGRSVHPSQVSEVAISSRTHATRVGAELEQRGWITRELCAGDRRRVELRLTPRGVALVERMLPVQRRRIQAIWSTLSDGEQHTLERLLRKMLGALAD